MVKCMFSSFLFGTVLGCLPHCWLWLSLEDILMIRWIWNISILTFCMLPLLLCARRKLKLWILLKSFFSSFCSKLLRCDIFSRWAPYFPEFSLQKKKIRSACTCVFVQVEDSHMIICDTSESLPPSPPSSPRPLRAFCLSSRGRIHCMHPNSITCHVAFLFLTHFLPSHLSLSFNSSFFPPLCMYWEKSVCFSPQLLLSCLPCLCFSSLSVPVHLRTYPSAQILSFLPLLLFSPSVLCPCISHIFLCFSSLLLSSSLCLPNVVLIMEKVHVQAGSIN